MLPPTACSIVRSRAGRRLIRPHCVANPHPRAFLSDDTPASERAFRVNETAYRREECDGPRKRAPETAERLAKSACLRLFTLIQGVARWLQPASASLDR